MTYEPGQQVLVRGEIRAKATRNIDEILGWGVRFLDEENQPVHVMVRAADVVGPAPATHEWVPNQAGTHHCEECGQPRDQHVGPAPATPDKGADVAAIRARWNETQGGIARADVFFLLDALAAAEAERDAARKLLAYLADQYERVVAVHEQVVMDTKEDRELHDRAIAQFREALTPVRRALSAEATGTVPPGWPTQQCTNQAPHAGHQHVNGGPNGGPGLPEWCPGVAGQATGTEGGGGHE